MASIGLFRKLENFLENVDQKAAASIKGDDVEDRPPPRASSLLGMAATGLMNKIAGEDGDESDYDSEEGDGEEKEEIVVTERTPKDEQAFSDVPLNSVTESDLPRLVKENGLLKSEMQALQEEIEDLVARNRKLIDRYNQATEKAKDGERLVNEIQQRHAKQVEHLMQAKMQSDDEFSNTIASRDAQQAALQARLDDIIHSLRAKDHLIDEMQQERDRLVSEQSVQMKAHAHALGLAKADVDHLKQQLEDEREALSTAQTREQQLESEVGRLERENEVLNRDMEHKESELHRYESQLRMKETECATVQQELQDYKARASKVLMAKDKMIDDLNARLAALPSDLVRNGSVSSVLNTQRDNETSESNVDGEPVPPSPASSSCFAQADISIENHPYVVQLLAEKEDAVAQWKDALAEIEKLKNSVERLTTQLAINEDVFAARLRESDATTERERRSAAKIQETAQGLSAALEDARAKLEKERKYAQEQMRMRDAHILRLEKQLATGGDTSELEQRVRTMAEHLIQKQSQIETLNSERSALQLHLDNALQRVREVEVLSRVTPSSSTRFRSYGDDSDVESGRVSNYFSSVNRRGLFATQINKAANLLDRITIRTSRYFRRYPILRLGAVFYIILLHVWLLSILFSASGSSTAAVASQPVAIAEIVDSNDAF